MRQSGCSVDLILVIGFAVKAFLATEGTPSVGNNMMAYDGDEDRSEQETDAGVGAQESSIGVRPQGEGASNLGLKVTDE